jgi:hypothetical protein
MNKTIKDHFLDHYRQREPSAFIQFDAFDDLPANELVHPDEEGHSLFCGPTYELMRGATLRILIKPGTSEKTITNLLDKIRFQISEMSEINQWKPTIDFNEPRPSLQP